MAFLVPDKTITVSSGGNPLEIKQKIMPDGTRAKRTIATHVPAGALMKPQALLAGDGKPRGITVHNTGMISVAAGTNAAEQYCRSTYNENMGGVIVHYYVWENEIWQLLDDTEQGWHAADGTTRRSSQREGERIGGNLDTIAIECIGDDARSEETTALLIAYLLHKHGLVPDMDVYTHNYFYSRKYCPVYILPHWGDFMYDVVRFYNTESGGTGGDGMYRVQVGAWTTWEYALAGYMQLYSEGYTPYMVETEGYFKVQLGAFTNQANAKALEAQLQQDGYQTYITTKAGTPVSMR